MARILIVDDDMAFRQTLAKTVEGLGHEVLLAATGREGLQVMIGASPDMAIVDYRMPDMDGLALLRSRHDDAKAMNVPVVMLTAYASSHNTIEAMKLGAFDHLTKPIGRQDVADVIERVLAAHDEPPAPRNEVAGDRHESLVGQSQAMRAMQKRIGMAAASDVPVLITGETGTGKELVARALHQASARGRHSFIAVNCAALPAELMESELFGHRKGAFSGATSDRKGHIREADGGSLFLDEIGDMPLSMQAKLLRVLQEGEVTPLGASIPEKVDVRLIAATHRDLERMVEEGAFRRDLLYRLNVVPIALLPLRERTADIILLAEHFLAAAKGPIKQLSPGAVRRLLAYAWPGNVRELKNAMDRCRVLVRGETIQASDLDGLVDASGADAGSVNDWLDGELPEAIARLEKAMIERALLAANGNRAEAARRLGIHRQLLYRKLDEFGLS
ncbi:two-component system NtrC family response regulator [Rhodanobacter sp. ANJX3]|uniref:sigma-54-dependent transcriptional regulator n=1 Tax=Rhodanobacter sp. ANJX3 TaxID=2723083 RepID=UPI001614BAB1|nr:sigma-54 dependent transcriptional regulator [Rhodanobacter sp. ANJX3]MBB5357650.1 two-component system NtrC family response regulator [Rhodanobacter sp. ANJX3]